MSGSLIWFRKGTHTEDVLLKDGVDVHFDTGSVLVGQIYDNGSPVTCKVFGEFEINRNTNNAITITGTNSDVTVECDTIRCVGTTITASPGVGNTTKLSVKARRIIGLTINYFVTVRGTSDVHVEVSEYCETALDTSQIAGIHLRDFDGNLYFETPLFIVHNSTTNNLAGVSISEEASCTGGNTTIIIKKMVNNYDYVTQTDDGAITKGGAGNMTIEVESFFSKKRVCILNSGIAPGSFLKVKGRFFCDENPVVRNIGVCELVIRESSLHRGDGGGDLNQVVVIGNVAGYPFTINEENYTEIINTTILKTTLGTDTLGALVARGDAFDASSTRVFLRDNIFTTIGSFTGYVVSAETAVTPDNDFYFDGCRSSIPTLASMAIIQKEAGGAGITVNDTYLSTYDYIK